jgi:hypothetical protein
MQDKLGQGSQREADDASVCADVELSQVVAPFHQGWS